MALNRAPEQSGRVKAGANAHADAAFKFGFSSAAASLPTAASNCASAAAAKRAASPTLEPDERKTDKRQKVGHGNGGGAASSSAAAAAASAAPSASASAAASSSAPPADAQPAQLETLDCSIRSEAFQCEAKDGEPSRIPRILPWARHEYCSDCVLKLLEAKPGYMQCPEGCGSLAVPIPAGVAAAGLASPSDWLRLLSPNKGMLIALRNTRALKMQLSRQGVSCSHSGCCNEVTHWCDKCCDLCALHESTLHQLLPGHACVPIHKKAAHLQSAARARVLGPAAAKVRVEAQTQLSHSQQELAAAHVQLTLLQQQVVQQEFTVEEKQRRVDKCRAAADQLASATDEEVIGYAAKAKGQRVRPEPAAAPRHPAKRHAPSDEAKVIEPAAQAASASVKPAAASGLLAEIIADPAAQLARLLKGRTLDGARLLYRASEHGFEASDFWQPCVGKANTLVLVQVAGNGNLIGAFTPAAWQAAAGRRPLYVDDPSLSTCLLSLRNARGRPCRLKLKEEEGEFALNIFKSCGPGYGLNDLRISNAKAADQPDGCYSHPYSFELDQECEAEAGLPPLPFKYSPGLLGGDDLGGRTWSNFAAAEVECWQLR